MVMLLLVVSMSNETTAPTSTVTFERPDFVLSQVGIPIYEFIPPEVNASYAEDLAYSLFRMIDSSATDAEDRYIVESGNKTFEMNKRDGSIWYADYDYLWNVAEGIIDHSPSMCRDKADTWLDEKGILPSTFVFTNYGSTNATAWNIDAGDSQSKVLQWHVNYEMFIGDIPVTGPGEQISVMIGGFGEIVGLSWNHRELKAEPYATLPLIEYESILEHYGISPEDVVEHKLTYYADSEDELNLLEPVYAIELNYADDGEDIFDVFTIPATLLNPEVEIVSPGHYLTFKQGHAIDFECVVTYGQPPYTYTWHSDFDGDISGVQNFTTSSLSTVDKKGVLVPHTISIQVRDNQNRWCMDYIAVFIEPGQLAPFPIELTIVAAAGGIIIVLGAAALLLKRRGVMGVLLFLLMLVSAFTILPIVSASGEVHNYRTFSPSAPEGAYDDGVKEVGIEWCGLSVWRPLPYSEENSEGFYNWMGGVGGFNKEFNWGEYSAWERDFKAEEFGGIDDEWVDAVDIVFYQDHGGPNGVTFRSMEDDKALHYRECRWGDGDLELLALDSCSAFRWENDTGHNVFQRWADTLQGIHMVCGFATTSQNTKTRGVRFAKFMTGFGQNPLTIKNSWFKACAETEGSDRVASVFYASKSPNPLNPQQDDPVNDHAYGFGYVCTDPVPGTFGWYVLINASC